jgi:hypothetical protein
VQEIACILRLKGNLRLTILLNSEDAACPAQTVRLINERGHTDSERQMRISGDFKCFFVRVHMVPPDSFIAYLGVMPLRPGWIGLFLLLW